MSYQAPNLNNPLVSAIGSALDGLRLWILNVTGTQLFRGTGSPEGVLEGIQDAQYVDTNTDVFYYKKLPEIGSDKSRGWVLVSSGNPLTAFGELSVAAPNPIIQMEFAYTINPRLITAISLGSGAAAVDNSLLTVNTGTTTESFLMLRSVRDAKYHAGQGILVRWTSIFDAAGVAGTEAISGFGNEEDGLFFGYNGADFGILHRSAGRLEYQTLTVSSGASSSGNITITLDGDATVVAVASSDTIQEVARKIGATAFDGWVTDVVGTEVIFRSDLAEIKAGAFSFVDTDTTGAAGSFAQSVIGAASTDSWTAQTAWNKDVMDGSGASGITLDHSKGNIYQVQLQWLGFGSINFYVESSETGKFVLVHVLEYANLNTTPSLQHPTLPLYISAKNKATTSDISVSSSSMAVFNEGLIDIEGLNNSAAGSRSGYDFTTETSVLAFRVKTLFQGKENRVEIRPELLSFSGNGAGACKFHTLSVWINPVLGGSPVFTDVDTATSIVEYDTAGTTITGGNRVGTFNFGKTIEGYSLDVTEIARTQPPGTLIVLAVEINAGTSDVDIGAIWRELF